MTLYLASLLEPFFDELRETLLHNPTANERLVPVIRCDAISTFDPTYLELSDTVILEQLYTFIHTSFPEPRLSALMHLPDPNSMVGEYFERFSITIHGRIAEAVTRQTVSVKQSKKSSDLLHFLIFVVNLPTSSARFSMRDPSVEIKDHPYAVELGNSLFELRFPEVGFQAEQVLFRGTIGVVFEDEIAGERPPFFEINYNRILYSFLQCADGKAYRLKSDVVAAKMESGLLTPFDITTLPSIPVPKLPKERTCAWLNSTHLNRRPPCAPLHPGELQGKSLPYSCPTPRAAQMERECRFPKTTCGTCRSMGVSNLELNTGSY